MKKLLASVAALVATTGLAFAAPTVLKMQSSNGAGEQVYVVQKAWADGIEEASGGRFKIDLLPLNAVVNSSNILSAVNNNLINGGITSTAVFAGDDAGFGLIGNTISAWATDEDILKFYYQGGGLELVDEVMQDWGAKLFGVAVTGSESFVSKVPLRKIDDFKGVKMRAPTGPVTKLFAAFGASPVNLPGSEVYTSLDKGVIDAADYSNFANNQSQGVNDIAKFPIYPGFHSSPTVHMFLNLDLWNSLSAEDQSFLETYAKGLAMDSLLSAHYEDRIAVGEALGKGIEPVAWDDAELVKVRQIASGIWEEIAAESEIGKAYLDGLKAYLESQGQL